MYAVVRHYYFDAKNSEVIDKMLRDEFVPLIKKIKGFMRYYWIDTGKGEGVSVSVFENKVGADESVRLAADFTSAAMASIRITAKPEIIEGPVLAHDLIADSNEKRFK